MVRRPQSSLPSNPIARLGHLWKNDPAYRILFIAISVVLLSVLICLVVFASIFNQPSPRNALGGGSGTQQAISTSVSTSGPTAAVTPTPASTPTPTPEPTPTPTPVPDTLTLQITSNLDTVKNNSTVPVSVNTNGGSGVTVHLSIVYKYDLFPSTSDTTDSQDTDSQGNATISWKVNARTFLPPGANATAEVTAVAVDQQGRRTTSKTVTVNISNN
jgi:hypothetical protein